MLAVDRTDASGLYVRSIQFNADDLEAALAELDAQYLAEGKHLENDATRAIRARVSPRTTRTTGMR